MQSNACKNRKGSRLLINLLMILAVVLLAVIPVFIAKNSDFSGTDDKAKKAITEINADYKPWFSPLIKPKSGEIEGLLFTLQAAIGAGVVGYGLGYMRASKKRGDKNRI